jgi:hypothetical protein
MSMANSASKVSLVMYKPLQKQQQNLAQDCYCGVPYYKIWKYLTPASRYAMETLAQLACSMGALFEFFCSGSCLPCKNCNNLSVSGLFLLLAITSMGYWKSPFDSKTEIMDNG